MKKYIAPVSKFAILEESAFLVGSYTEEQRGIMDGFLNDHNNNTGKGNAWSWNDGHIVDKHGNDKCDSSWDWVLHP